MGQKRNQTLHDRADSNTIESTPIDLCKLEDVLIPELGLKTQGIRIVKRIVLFLGIVATAHVAGLNPALAKGEGDKTVVATVNGNTISLSDVEDARTLLPAQFQSAPLQRIYPMLVETLVNSRISADMAKRLGFDETPVYKRRMERISDQVLERILLTRHLEQKITDILVQERYLKLVERASSQKESHARHILLKTEKEAQAVLEKLNDGEDFADVARELSAGPSGPNGGDLGWFGPGRMVPQFDNAVNGLSLGAYTQKPVQTQFGWHIIFLEDRRPLPIKTFDQARPGLVNNLSAELGQKLMEQLRNDADIEITSFKDLPKPPKPTGPKP